MGGWVAPDCSYADREDLRHPYPVGYVRSHYSDKALETPEQRRYVDGFDVAALQQWLFGRAWRERWYRTVFGGLR